MIRLMHHLLMWYISERCNAPKVYTYREEIRDEILENMMNNKILFDNGQEETQKTNLMYEQRTKKDAKRLAVSAIASRRGEKGA